MWVIIPVYQTYVNYKSDKYKIQSLRNLKNKLFLAHSGCR